MDTNSISPWKNIFSSAICAPRLELVLWLRMLGQTVCFLPLFILQKPLQQWALMCNRLCWSMLAAVILSWVTWWYLFMLHAYPKSLFPRIMPKCWEQLCLLMQKYYYNAFKTVMLKVMFHVLMWSSALRQLDTISRPYPEVVKVFAVFILSFQRNVLQPYTALLRISFHKTQWGNLGVMFNIFIVTFIHIHKVLCRHLQCIFRSCS